MLKEIFLNIIGFTDFFYKEMLTSLISFSSRNTFSLNLLLKSERCFRLKNYHEFLRFFFCDQPYRLRGISQTSKLNSSTKNVSVSTWFIHFDGLCNYLDSFQKQLAVNFCNNNNRCFPFQGHVGHYTNKFTETRPDVFIKYILRPI